MPVVGSIFYSTKRGRVFASRKGLDAFKGLIQKRVSQMPLVVLIQRQSFRCSIIRAQAEDRGSDLRSWTVLCLSK